MLFPAISFNLFGLNLEFEPTVRRELCLTVTIGQVFIFKLTFSLPLSSLLLKLLIAYKLMYGAKFYIFMSLYRLLQKARLKRNNGVVIRDSLRNEMSKRTKTEEESREKREQLVKTFTLCLLRNYAIVFYLWWPWVTIENCLLTQQCCLKNSTTFTGYMTQIALYCFFVCYIWDSFVEKFKNCCFR